MREQEQAQSPSLKFLRPDVFQVGAIAGVIAAITIFGYSFLLYSIGENAFGRYKFLLFPIYGFFFAGAMTYFRLKKNNGKMAGHHGLLIGLTLNIVCYALYTTLIYLLLSTKEIGKAMLERHRIDLIDLMVRGKDNIVEGFGEEMYNQNLNDLKEGLEPFAVALDQYIILLIGILLTFLFMLIIKQK
ncbi:DUF4199 family protein [Flammeovirga aprica]|uniref:DUF4199 family protein n=1 Tax=Flammeovirga aprica JL-4 TaxID=694437 RepID=A0A7X9RTQ2_9BACT|nr:DUF4199 family protein [Flammeovirga aprica]NME67639.1 DUF4199 family protein [Flammeovirga aprica JL-4]